MTSTPTSPDSEGPHFEATPFEAKQLETTPSDLHPTGGFSAATIEGLVRYDEASPEVIAKLEREPGALAVLNKLRAADAFLKSGAMLDSTPESAVSPEELFAFGRGELEPSEAEVVREHLAHTPQENEWVKALRGSTPPATLTWDRVDNDSEKSEELGDAQSTDGAPVLAGPGSTAAPNAQQPLIQGERADSPGRFPAWLAWTPLAAAALILAMAIGGTGQRSVLDGGLPNSPIMRSASTDALLFPRGRVIASTDTVRTYASQPLFEVTPVAGASRYGFELRKIDGQSVFAEGKVVWESTATSHQASAPALSAGKYTWTATATVQGIDRVLGSLSFTVVPARAVDRALFVRAATGQASTMPGILREDIRRLHASGFLTDARSKARSLPPGKERDKYLAIPSGR